MDEQYIKDIYNNLGGETKFGSYEDFYTLITTDDSYIQDFHSAFGSNVLGDFEDFNSIVKKKETEEDGGFFGGLAGLATAAALGGNAKRGYYLGQFGNVMNEYEPEQLAAQGSSIASQYQNYLSGILPAVHSLDGERQAEIDLFRKENPFKESVSYSTTGAAYMPGAGSTITTVSNNQKEIDSGIQEINSKYNTKYKRQFLDEQKKRILKEKFGVESYDELSDRDKFAASELSDYFFAEFGLDLQLDDDDRYNEDFFLNDAVRSLAAGLVDLGAATYPLAKMSNPTLMQGMIIEAATTGKTINEVRQKDYADIHNVAEGVRDARTKYSDDSSGMTKAFENGYVYSGVRQLVSGVAEATPQVAAAVALTASGVGAPAAAGILGGVGASSHYHQTEYEDNKLIEEGRGDEVQYDSPLERAGASLIAGGSDALMTVIIGGVGKGISGAASKEMTRGMFKQMGIAASEGAIEEAGAELALIAYDVSLGKPITTEELIRRVVDAGSVGAFMPISAAPMSMALKSSAASKARSERISSTDKTQQVEDVESQSQALREQEGDPKKQKVKGDASKAFFQMLAVRHPEAMDRINQIDFEIESLALQIRSKEKGVYRSGQRYTSVDFGQEFTQESGIRPAEIDPKRVEEIQILKNKVDELQKERSSIKSQYSNEDLNLSDQEIRLVRRDFIESKIHSLRNDLEAASEEISSMESDSGAEGFDYSMLDEAKVNRDQVSQRLAEAEEILSVIDDIKQKISDSEDNFGTEAYEPAGVDLYNDLAAAQVDLANLLGFRVEATEFFNVESDRAAIEERQQGREEVKNQIAEIESSKDAASRANAVTLFDNAVSRGREVTQREIDIVNQTKQSLSSEGFVVDNIQEGQIFEENTDADVTFVDDENIPQGVQFVEQVNRPEVVDSEGNVVQRAVVSVRRGTAESDTRSGILNTINNAEQTGNTAALASNKTDLELFDKGVANEYMRGLNRTSNPNILKPKEALKQEPVDSRVERGIVGQFKDYRPNKDGSVSITPNESNRLTTQEAKDLNRILSQVGNVLGNNVTFRIHGTEESGNRSALKNIEGGRIEGLYEVDNTSGKTTLHVNVEAIRSAIEENNLKGKDARNYFRKVLVEETTHASLSAALRTLYKTDPKALTDLSNKFVGIVKSDSDLAKAIDQKIEAYEEAGYDEGAVLDEVIAEIISSVSSGLNFADITTISKIKVWINQVLQKAYGKKAKELYITDNESVASVIAKFKNIVDNGDYVKVREHLSESNERASLKNQRGINPSKLPEDTRFTVSFSQRGYDAITRFDSKEFNGKWHFINWWNQSTNKGESDKLSNFKLIVSQTESRPIDADVMKKWNLKRPLTYAQKKKLASEKESERKNRSETINNLARQVRQSEVGEAEFSKKNSAGYDKQFLVEKYKDFFEGVDLPNINTQDVSTSYADRVSSFKLLDEAINNLDEAKANELIDRLSDDIGDSADNGVTERAYFSAKKVLLDEGKKLDMSNYSDLRRRVVCGMAGATCNAFKRTSDLEFLAHLVDQTLGENANDLQRGLLLSRFLEVGAPQIVEMTGLDARNFYRDYEDGRKSMMDVFAADVDLPDNVSEFGPAFDTLMAIFSNGQKSFKNTHLAMNVFYHSMRSQKQGHDSKFIPEYIIRKIERNEDGYDLGDIVGERRRTVVAHLKSANEMFATYLSEAGSFNGSKFFEDMAKKDVDSKGNENGLRVIQRTIGDEAFKIGAFALNLMGDRNVLTADRHVNRHIGIVRAKGAEMVDDMQFISESKRRSLIRFLVDDAKVDPSDLIDDESIVRSIVDVKKSKDKELSRAARKKFNSVFNSDPYQRASRSQYVTDQLLVEKAVKSYNTNMGLEGSDALSVRDAGQVMYALGQLANTNYKGKFEYTPYKPDIEKVLQTESYKDLTKLDEEALNASEKAQEDVIIENASISGFKATERIVNAQDHPLYRQRGRKGLEYVNNNKDIVELTEESVREALDTDRVSKRIESENNEVNVGDKVGIRLNLNVKKNTGVPVQTIHSKNASGKALQYAGAVVVKNAELFVNPNARKKIALFQENKFPMASVNGEFVSKTISEADFDGVKALFNPFSNAAFVDVSGRPIKRADEATIIGSNVFLRGKIEYYDYNDPTLKKAMVETPAERAKRVKQGDKYERSLKKFEAYSKGALKTEYESREALQEAYENMPLVSKQALDDSQVAEGMLANMERASIARKNIDGKIRRTAQRATKIAGLDGKTSTEILNNPENYFTPQKLSEVKDRLQFMSNDELFNALKTDSVRKLAESDRPVAPLAAAELVNRLIETGNQSDIPAIIERLSKDATFAARVLVQMKELRSSTPLGMVSIIQQMAQRRGQTLSEGQLEKATTLANTLFTINAEFNDLVQRVHQGEDTTKQIKQKQKEYSKALFEMETFTNSVIEKGFFNLATAAMQGNLLTFKSQAVNVGANLINLFAMLPRDVIAYPIQKILNAAGLKDDVSRAPSISAYLYGAQAFGAGFLTAGRAIFTGENKADFGKIPEWRMNASFAPIRSLSAAFSKKGSERLPVLPNGESSLQLKQRAKLLFQGTLGFAPEIFFRMLDLGDRPFRQAVQTADLARQATALGLKGEARRNFIKYPPSKAREAAAIQGAKATFQEDTPMSRLAMRIVGAAPKAIKDPVLSDAVEFVIRSQAPYVKTPANIVDETLTYVLPAYSVGKAVNSMAKGDARDASQQLAKGVIGGMAAYVALDLLADNLISGAIEWDEDEEKNIAYSKFPPSTINISGVRRKYFTDDPNPGQVREDDEFVSYDQLGIVGAVMGAYVKGYKGKKEVLDDPKRDLLVSNNAIRSALGIDGLSGAADVMDQGFLTGTDNLLQIISTLQTGRTGSLERAVENWADDTFRAVSATVLPNTLSQVHRVNREYMPDARVNRGDDFFERLAYRARYTIYDRTFGKFGGDFPVRVDWKGNPIKQTPEGRTPFWYQMFDITKARAGESDVVTNEVYRLYEETEDLSSIVGTPSFASRRDVSVPDFFDFNERTGRAFLKNNKNNRALIKTFGPSFENRFTFLKDKEFVSDKVKLTTEQINNVLSISGKDRYEQAARLIGSVNYQRMNTEDRIKALNELDDNKFGSVITIADTGYLSNHTIALLNMIQELYEKEREE